MNQREMFKSIIGTAVAIAVPSMPFVWHELSYSEIVANTLRARHKELAAAFWRNNALLRKLAENAPSRS